MWLPPFRGRRQRSLISCSTCTCSWPQPGGRREGQTDARLAARGFPTVVLASPAVLPAVVLICFADIQHPAAKVTA